MMKKGRGGPRDAVGARALLRKTCAQREPQACGDLAEMQSKGIGGPTLATKARSNAEKACEQQVPKACHLYGGMLLEAQGGPREIDGALEALHSACTAGHGKACRRGGQAIEQFDLSGRDLNRWYSAGCANSDAGACFGAALTMPGFSPSSRQFAVRGALLLIGLELQRERKRRELDDM